MLKKSLGLDTPQIAPELNNLAAHRQRQRFAAAEPLFKCAGDPRKDAAAEHPDDGQSRNNLATLYVKQERYADAEPLAARAHPTISPGCTSTSSVFLMPRGSIAARSIRERAPDPDHPDVVTSTSNLTFFLQESGRNADALPLPETTLARRCRSCLPRGSGNC